MIMLAKGIELQVTNACKTGGFYLGSGGPAAILAQDNILKVEIVDFELGMEAVRKITIKDFLLLLRMIKGMIFSNL
jgi:fumarate hydratase class I